MPFSLYLCYDYADVADILLICRRLISRIITRHTRRYAYALRFFLRLIRHYAILRAFIEIPLATTLIEFTMLDASLSPRDTPYAAMLIITDADTLF